MIEHDPGVVTRSLFSQPARAGVALAVLFSAGGGVAMATFGLGLQADKPRAAGAAVLSTTLTSLVMLACIAAMVTGGSSLFTLGWQALLLTVCLVATGFSVAAWRQVRRDPPPPGVRIYHTSDFPPSRYG